MPNWNLNPRFFNANEKVRIRPTAEGLEYLKRWHHHREVELARAYREDLKPSVSVFVALAAQMNTPQPDADGWIEMALHEVMSTFGPAMGNGADLFDMNIQLDAAHIEVSLPRATLPIGAVVLTLPYEETTMAAELVCPNESCTARSRSRRFRKLDYARYECVGCNCVVVFTTDRPHVFVV